MSTVGDQNFQNPLRLLYRLIRFNSSIHAAVAKSTPEPPPRAGSHRAAVLHMEHNHFRLSRNMVTRMNMTKPICNFLLTLKPDALS